MTPEHSQSALERISEHIADSLGEIVSVFHQKEPGPIHVDIHVVKPNERHPFVSLVTSGMSDLPMSTPDGANATSYLELLLMLPCDWRLDRDSLEDERWYWPVRLLQVLAGWPHKRETWLGLGHTIANGNPSRPYAPDTGFCGCVILPPLKVPGEFHRLKINATKEVHFLSVIPLYEEEMSLTLRSGIMALINRLADAHVDAVINPERANVAKAG